MFYRLGALLPLLLCLWALLVQTTSSSPTPATQVVDTDVPNRSIELDFPPALSHTCGGLALPIDYDQPICCVNGYVYLNGTPVPGATVTISANGQSVTVQTEQGEDDHPAHFGVSLSEAPLEVLPGQTVTITAEFGGITRTRTFIAQSGGQQQDIVLPQTGGLLKRLDHAMAYDGQDVILFGGLDDNGRLNDTLRWDGESWTRAEPPVSPPSRNKHAMAYDSVRERIVLFGGYEDSDSRLNDTWEWDGTTWTNVSAFTSLTARTSHAMVYDAAREQIVLFGGYDGENFLNDTWLWDGMEWTVVMPPNPPSGRANHAMAYDAERGNVVLFGGYDGTTYLGDTWLWDGEIWTQESPAAGASPPARFQHTMEYDMANDQVVLFSGFNGSYLNDTWLWNGTTWTERDPQNSPQARREHAMAYDTNRERIVLFGGDDQGRLGDTWEWDGNNWALRATGDVLPTDAPPIATINHISPRDARQGSDSITFRGSAGDADATDIILNYRWTLDEQEISTQANFTLTAEALYDFSVGTKTISFQVQDDEGTWSEPNQQTIYIRDDEGGTGGDTTWTLLIYAVADNNLDHWMGDNPNANGMLHRLSLAGAQDNVQVGILYDGPTAGDTRLYILEEDGDWIQEAWDEPEARMGNIATLEKFINWGYDRFDSEYYALSLVDHANGIIGFGQDESSPNDDPEDETPFLTPLELREALRLGTNEGERKIDVLHYDGCSFGLLEDAAIARGLAHYVVASPYTGWGIFAYETYRQRAGSASNPQEYARAIAQEYALGVEYWGFAYTISVFDMAYFEEVNSAVSILGDTLVQYVDGDLASRISQLRSIRDSSQKYDDGKNNIEYDQEIFEIDNEDSYVDIVDFVLNLQNEVNDQNVTTTAANVQSSIEEGFVIYEEHRSGPFNYQGTTYTADLSHAYGLGIFYPRRSTGSAYDNYVNNHLFDTTADSGWTRFLLQGIPAQGNNGQPGLSENQLISPLLPENGSVEHKLFLPSVLR